MSHIEPTEDISIPVPWGIISGKWWGSRDQKPVICLHGWQDNAGTFDPLISLLPSTVSFLCVDLPGHGKSSHFPPGMSYYLWSDGVITLRRIVKHFGWNNIKIMGHSLGGGIGFLYAAVFPNDVELLISLDIVAPIFQLSATEYVNKTAVNIDKFLHYDQIKDTKDPCEDYETMIDITFSGHNETLTRKSCETMMKRGMSLQKNEKYKFARDNRLKVGFLSTIPYDVVLEFATRVKCRYMNVKAIPGRTLDNWPKYKEVLDIIEENAFDFCFITAEGSHHVHLNEPEKVAPAISDFLLKYND